MAKKKSALSGRIKSLRVSFKKINVKKLSIFALILGLLALGYLVSKFLVVAWVDKKPITRFEYFKALDQKYGKEVKEQLIVEQLINAEALKNGSKVEAFELEAEIKKIEEQQGGKDKLDQILQVQGISQTEFKKLVRLQLLKQKLFGKDITISDDEVKKFLSDQNQLDPVDDKQKEEIKQQLKQQKINTNFNNWLKEALQSSRVSRV